MLSHKITITYLLIGAALLILLASMVFRPGSEVTTELAEQYKYTFTGKLFCSDCNEKEVSLILYANDEQSTGGTALMHIIKYVPGKAAGIKDRRSAFWTTLHNANIPEQKTLIEVTDTLGEASIFLAPSGSDGEKKFSTLTQTDANGNPIDGVSEEKGILTLNYAGPIVNKK